VPSYYLDSSALLKRYRTEKGTETLDELFESNRDIDLVTTSSFTVLEVISVITRLFRINTLSRRSYQRLLGDLRQDVRQTIVLQPVADTVLAEAVRLIMDHSLRAPDAVQLATALSVRNENQERSTFMLCSDVRLKRACEGSGLAVIDPEAPNSLDLLRASQTDRLSS